MDVSAILLDILIVLVAAKAAAEIAERIHIPAVVGEIVAGMIIGPSVLGLVGHSQVLATLAELGVILLLLEVGMEMNLGDLRSVGRASAIVAIIGVVVPMTTGFGIAEVFGYDFNTALFLGAALAATSVGITARVFSDLRALATVEARTVLGAAVADDVLGLVILTVVVRIVTEGSVSLGAIITVVGVAVAFLLFTTLAGQWLAPKLFGSLGRRSRSSGTVVAIALAFTLAFAELAHAAKLAPIIGAFVAGLSLGSTDQAERIRRELRPVGHLFIPVFFLQIGIEIDIQQFANPSVLGIAAALFLVAVAGKMVASAGVMGSAGDKMLVGLGMVPRGEVGLIFATIGRQAGVLGDDLYASLLLVVLVTTIMTPPLLRWRLLQIRRADHPRPSASGAAPPGGWLTEHDGVIDIAASPPNQCVLHVSLDAALAMTNARPGSALLDWLGAIAYDDDAPAPWDRAATEKLFGVLAHGNVRSWRFLEATGTLERSLPELADAIRRRHANPFELDPNQLLRFSLVESVRELARDDTRAAIQYEALNHPGWLLLAALIMDAAGDGKPPPALARQLVTRIDLGEEAERQIALLLDDATLMRGMALRSEALSEDSIMQLAVHLGARDGVRALYLLSLALGELGPTDRERLDEMLATILQLLDAPAVTGVDTRNAVDHIRSEARNLLGDDAAAVERLRHAPRGYLLTQTASTVAHQVKLLSHRLGRTEVRVQVEPTEADMWRVDVACRDRYGLLATITGVLAAAEIDVSEAVVATWDDGAALESFLVRRARRGSDASDDASAETGTPDAHVLAAQIEAALDEPLTSLPSPDVEICFDDHASPWYTTLEVASTDRLGFLHRVAVGLASAGANVHSAHLVTRSGRARDRFELTDANERKLDAEMKQAIRDAVAAGVVPAVGRVRLLRWPRSPLNTGTG